MVETTREPQAVPASRKRHRSRWRKRFSRRLQYVLLRGCLVVLSRLPLTLGRWLAAIVGTGCCWVLRRERAIALSNLTQALGDEKSPAELRLLTRRVFRHTTTTFVEWVIIRRWSRERIEQEFGYLREDLQALGDDVRSQPCGVVGFSAHFGNWEVLLMLYSFFNQNGLVGLAKPSKSPKMRDFLKELRCVHTVAMVYTDESPRKLIRALREKKLLGFLADQDIRNNRGIFVEFFGRPTHTVTFPVALGRKVGAPMVLCLLVREGKKFRVIRTPLEPVAKTDDEDADLAAGTQWWTTALEGAIRQAPEQWLWFYPRWRTQPGKLRRHKAGRAS